MRLLLATVVLSLSGALYAQHISSVELSLNAGEWYGPSLGPQIKINRDLKSWKLGRIQAGLLMGYSYGWLRENDGRQTVRGHYDFAYSSFALGHELRVWQRKISLGVHWYGGWYHSASKGELSIAEGDLAHYRSGHHQFEYGFYTTAGYRLGKSVDIIINGKLPMSVLPVFYGLGIQKRFLQK